MSQIHPIGYVKSPYKEKFGIPRQPGLVTAAEGCIEFVPPFDHPDYIRGLTQFTHLWLIFEFHQTKREKQSALVRPPRMGGNDTIGVFASRSTFRPNNLGLSVVKLEAIHQQPPKIVISGMDLLDNTPIFDIKPYIPYADSIPNADAGFAQLPPIDIMQVTFSDPAFESIKQYAFAYPNLQTLIKQVLSQDPRPAYQRKKTSNREYGVLLSDFNIIWRVEKQSVNHVLRVEKTHSAE